MRAHGNVSDMAAEPVGSRYIWAVPDILRSPLAPDATPLEITGYQELKLGHAVCHLGPSSIAIFNALQMLTEQDGRDAVFPWGRIEAELREDRYEFSQLQRFHPAEALRVSEYLRSLAAVSGIGIRTIIESRRRYPDAYKGTGNPVEHRFNPALYLIDNRDVSAPCSPYRSQGSA